MTEQNKVTVKNPIKESQESLRAKEALNREIEELNVKKVANEFDISPELLEEARRALHEAGPLHVADKYKEPGYVYEWSLDVPGNLDRKERLGFQIVRDENLRFGDEKSNQAHRLGSAVVCMWKSTTPLVLMRIDEKRHRAIQMIKREDVQATERAMGRIDNVPIQYTYGESLKK